MTYRLVAFTVASLFILAGLPAQAQGLRPSAGNAPAAPVVRSLPDAAQAADFIVAIVNSEPITNSEMQREVQRVTQQLAQQRTSLPERKELTRQVLESLINQKVQLQQARESGVRIDEPAVDQALQNIARQNQIEVAELSKTGYSVEREQ